MATQQSLFDATRFDPTRSELPRVELVHSLAKATDVIIGLANPRERPTLVGAPAELESRLERNQSLLNLLLEQGAGPATDESALLILGGLRVIAVGLGDDLDVSPEELRQAAGWGVRRALAIRSPGPRRIAISLEATSKTQIRAAAEGALLACDQFSKLSHQPSDQMVEAIWLVGQARVAQQAIETARIVAQAVAVARDWSNLPANLLGPAEMADQARSYLRDARLNVEVLDERALEKGGYQGILAVGGGSTRPPRLLRMAYHPRGARKHLVLVGKGITYDSGGFNLKPGASLLTMKHDMAGAAAVICALRAIVQCGLAVRVTAYAPLAEQMISGSAYRPGDVLRMFDGTTVENSDSDCEGRIVLADALARAGQDEPDLLVDVATLTGACMVALGTRMAGLMASDDATADRLLDAAEAAGEDFWQLPITDEVRKRLKSRVADLRSKDDRHGGALFAAAFLQHFVADQTPWAHLDIAGPAWNRAAAHDYVPVDATGFGVRTLVALAESLAG